MTSPKLQWMSYPSAVCDRCMSKDLLFHGVIYFAGQFGENHDDQLRPPLLFVLQ